MNKIELIPFYDLNKEEALEVLTWRNHKDIRKWMYTQELITQEHHFTFISQLKNHPKKRYFLLNSNGNKIASIDFTDIQKESCHFGLYVNPFEDVKGRGTIAMQTICEYAFNTLKVQTLRAKVFAHNEKAIHLYKKFHFTQVAQKEYGEKTILSMELHL